MMLQCSHIRESNFVTRTSSNETHCRLIVSSRLRPQPTSSISKIPGASPRQLLARRWSQAQHRDGRRACTASGGQPSTYIGSLSSQGLKFGVVAARFNELVTKPLLEGVLEGLERHGTQRDTVTVAWVPGSFELPLVAKAMAKSGKYDAVITVGAVVRGATAHFDAVVGGATSGVLSAGLDSGVPVIFCVMTTDTMEQALDRAGGKSGNKGFEAAVTAIETANVLKALGQQGLARGRDAW
ncbi:hypothetical protein WJX75_007660 [Coccomyxa subellipsoidea]|uniref:6,7-dimethyl-8-ribityllumazine synthase n=1 Tax=Coccomyxa subellipsoidea TaxID=248742 RepID=A0ABR2Z4L6_9CHLO